MFGTVDEFNANGEYIGARIDAPKEWGKFHETTSTADIIRAQLKISNRGLDVIDAVPLPLCAAMGKTDSEDAAVGVTNFNLMTNNKWVDRYDYDEKEKAIRDSWNFSSAPSDDNIMFPMGSLRHGTHTTFNDISPEASMFDNTPLATPIKAAMKYATICKSANVDPDNYLRTVEGWWGMDEGTLDMISIPQIADISYPRVAGSSSKNSSPIYGMDNYAGRVEIEHTGLTRESFLNEKEEADGTFSVADFGRFNAFLRYVVGLSDALPGASRDSIRNKIGRALWAISPDYAFKYKKEDFIVRIPKNELPVVKAGKAARVIVDYLGSDEYIRHLISMYSKIDVDEDYTFTGVDVRNKLIQLKKQITNPLPKPLILTLDDITPSFELKPKSIPDIKIKKDICTLIIENMGLNTKSTPEVAASIGAFINICSDSKYELTDDESKQVILVNSASNMVSTGAKSAIKGEIKTQYGTTIKMAAAYGVHPMHQRDVFENAMHVTLVSNYRGVVIKVFGLRDKFATIYVDEMDKGKVHPDAVEVKGVADALKAWSSYYFSKCWKLTDKDTEADMEKVVMYSSMARILSSASFNVKQRKLTWPDIAGEIVRKATNYAKKRKKTFTIDPKEKDFYKIAESIDDQLEPDISFKNLASCIESCIFSFEDDLLSRKTNFDPTDCSSFPRRWVPKQVSTGSGDTMIDDETMNFLLMMAAEQEAGDAQIKIAMDNKDIYDVIYERTFSLFLKFEDVLAWVNSKYGIKATDLASLRASKVDVKPDDLDAAVKKGILVQDSSSFEVPLAPKDANNDDDIEDN